MSTTETSTAPVFSLASSTVKSSGNCVKPLPHSTPDSIACETVSTLVRSDRFAVFRRLLTPYTICMPITNTNTPRITAMAVREIALLTCEPDGSCSDSGSILPARACERSWSAASRSASAASPAVRRAGSRRLSLPSRAAARLGSSTPEESSSEKSSSASSGVILCLLLIAYLTSRARVPSNCIR